MPVKEDFRQRSEIIRSERQNADWHLVKVIITLSENPNCPQETYSIINHFFHVIR